MTMSVSGALNQRNDDAATHVPDPEPLRATAFLHHGIQRSGALVMSRETFNTTNGYGLQVPVFVLTRRGPDELGRREDGQPNVTFVTDGIESAVAQARAAAENKDVAVIGGPNTARLLLQAGLVDELQPGIRPVLIGDRLRFFEHLSDQQVQRERLNVVEPANRTDVRYRVVRPTITFQSSGTKSR